MEKHENRPQTERRNMTKRSESQKAMVARTGYLNNEFKPTLVQPNSSGVVAANKDKAG